MKSEAPTAEEYAEHYGVPVEEAREYLAKAAEVEEAEQRCLSEIFAGVNGPVIELGAGAGEFTRELLDRYLKPGQRLYALERLESVASKLRESVKDDRLEVLNSDSQAISLPDGSAALVISRVALHDFVSVDGDIERALLDCRRVLAPGGTFVVYDKIVDGFAEHERQSAEGRMERTNVEFAALEGKKCWGLHRMADYVFLLGRLGLGDIRSQVLPRPDMPGYVAHLRKNLDQARPSYLKRWGEGVNAGLDALYRDLESTPNKALPLAIIWGKKAFA